MSASYEVWSSHMAAGVPFYLALAVEAEGPLVELAVGDGRVAFPVARATGRRVVGIDIVLDDGATSSLWWATKNEWLGLIDVAGLEVEALYGDFDRTPLNSNSGEYVFVTRRRHRLASQVERGVGDT